MTKPMKPTLRHLLLVLSLLLGVLGHGTLPVAAGEVLPTAMQHLAPPGHLAHAGPEHNCGEAAGCQIGAPELCTVNHCLLGVVTEPLPPLPPFLAARPLAQAVPVARLELQRTPERPPRAA